MLPIHEKIKLILGGLLYCILSGILVTIIFGWLPESWKLNKYLDEFFYRHFFTATQTPPAHLIIIDSQDDQEKRSRGDYAEMIHRLGQANARCIAFDIVFFEQRMEDQIGNRNLIKAVNRYPQVILAIDFNSDRVPSGLTRAMAENLAIPSSECEERFLPKFLNDRGVDFPFDSLLAVTKHIGHINPVNKEYHHFPIAFYYLDKFYPALPLEIKKVYLAKANYSSLFDEIPLDNAGQLMVNFIPAVRFKPNTFSWDDALELVQSKPDRFKNSVVLVINSATDEMIPTPIGIIKNWVVIASVTSQLLQNRHIDASPLFSPVFISAFLVLMGLLWFLFGKPRKNKKWRKTRYIFIPWNALFFLIIFLLLRFGQLWMGVFIPLLIFNASLLFIRAKYYRIVKPPQFVDLAIYILESQDKKYPVKVESLAGTEEENAFFESFIEEESFKNILQKIKHFSASRKEMQWLGNKLFSAIFQADRLLILKSCMEIAKRENKYLRIRLNIDASELICLPWELMYSSKLPPGFLVLNKMLSLTRYISITQTLRKPSFQSPLKILVVAANPSGTGILDLAKEIKLLKKSLRPLIWGRDVRLRICEKATLENIRKELDLKPDVLHYIGHSYYDSNLDESFICLESDTDTLDRVDQETFCNLLHESSIKLMVLNSCESAMTSSADTFIGIAPNLVKFGVPTVLAMQFEIPDQTAIWFSSIFYSTFLTNYSIEVAVAQARRFIMSKTKLDHPDWSIPVLFMRSCEEYLY